MSEGYKQDYLKLTPRENIKYIGSVMVDVCRERLPFGFFSDPIYSNKNEWVILNFHPHSKDVNYPSHYETRQEALADAIKHLNDRKFDVKPFDLEGLVDSV